MLYGARRLLASHELFGANCCLADTSGLEGQLICWSFCVTFSDSFVWSYASGIVELDPLSEGDLGSVPLTQAMIFR